MTNLQKYAQLHKILAEAAVYRRAVGKLEFDMLESVASVSRWIISFCWARNASCAAA